MLGNDIDALCARRARIEEELRASDSGHGRVHTRYASDVAAAALSQARRVDEVADP